MIVAWGKVVVDGESRPIVPKDTNPKDLEVLLEAYGDVKNYDPTGLQLTTNQNFQTVQWTQSKIFENTCLKDYKKTLLDALNGNLPEGFEIVVEEETNRATMIKSTTKDGKTTKGNVKFTQPHLGLTNTDDEFKKALYLPWNAEAQYVPMSEHGKLMYSQIINPFYDAVTKEAGKKFLSDNVVTKEVKPTAAVIKKINVGAKSSEPYDVDANGIYWYANRVFHAQRTFEKTTTQKVLSNHEKCLITIIEDWTALFKIKPFNAPWQKRAKQLIAWDPSELDNITRSTKPDTGAESPLKDYCERMKGFIEAVESKFGLGDGGTPGEPADATDLDVDEGEVNSEKLISTALKDLNVAVNGFFTTTYDAAVINEAASGTYTNLQGDDKTTFPTGVGLLAKATVSSADLSLVKNPGLLGLLVQAQTDGIALLALEKELDDFINEKFLGTDAPPVYDASKYDATAVKLLTFAPEIKQKATKKKTEYDGVQAEKTAFDTLKGTTETAFKSEFDTARDHFDNTAEKTAYDGALAKLTSYKSDYAETWEQLYAKAGETKAKTKLAKLTDAAKALLGILTNASSSEAEKKDGQGYSDMIKADAELSTKDADKIVSEKMVPFKGSLNAEITAYIAELEKFKGAVDPSKWGGLLNTVQKLSDNDLKAILGGKNKGELSADGKQDTNADAVITAVKNTLKSASTKTAVELSGPLFDELYLKPFAKETNETIKALTAYATAVYSKETMVENGHTEIAPPGILQPAGRTDGTFQTELNKIISDSLQDIETDLNVVAGYNRTCGGIKTAVMSAKTAKEVMELYDKNNAAYDKAGTSLHGVSLDAGKKPKYPATLTDVVKGWATTNYDPVTMLADLTQKAIDATAEVTKYKKAVDDKAAWDDATLVGLMEELTDDGNLHEETEFGKKVQYGMFQLLGGVTSSDIGTYKGKLGELAAALKNAGNFTFDSLPSEQIVSIAEGVSEILKKIKEEGDYLRALAVKVGEGYEEVASAFKSARTPP